MRFSGLAWANLRFFAMGRYDVDGMPQAAQNTHRLSPWILSCFFLVLTSCGQPKPQTSAPLLPPTVAEEPIAEAGNPILVLGANAPVGFLRPCQTLIAAGGVVELRCGEHQLVEFRKGASAGETELDLDDLMEVLQARFGELRENRHEGKIDSFPVRLSHFRTQKSGGPRGVAVAISNSQGQYWVFACYKKSGETNREFCHDAIATAARSGGLAHVEAKKRVGFADGILSVPTGCVSSEASRITCNTGQLSWSPLGGKPASELLEEAVAQIVSMAAKKKVIVTQSTRSCQLLGAKVDCMHLRLANREAKEELHFVLAQSGTEERLIVCSFASFEKGRLPEPCSQIIDLQGASTPPL